MQVFQTSYMWDVKFDTLISQKRTSHAVLSHLHMEETFMLNKYFQYGFLFMSIKWNFITLCESWETITYQPRDFSRKTVIWLPFIGFLFRHLKDKITVIRKHKFLCLTTTWKCERNIKFSCWVCVEWFKY